MEATKAQIPAFQNITIVPDLSKKFSKFLAHPSPQTQQATIGKIRISLRIVKPIVHGNLTFSDSDPVTIVDTISEQAKK